MVTNGNGVKGLCIEELTTGWISYESVTKEDYKRAVSTDRRLRGVCEE
jgi:hypothetical protein